MKIPEPLFKTINFVVRLLLKSPIHSFWSDSLLVIGFNGRKTGKYYETPVRYVKASNVIQCFTSKTGKWWRNVRDNPSITALVVGQYSSYQAVVTTDDSLRIGTALTRCLELYPQDAVYHDISIGPEGMPDHEDIENALANVVLIELYEQKDT